VAVNPPLTVHEMAEIILEHRISLYTGTRIDSPRAIPIWIARKDAISASHVEATEAVTMLLAELARGR
jgi:hypothetical protein